MNIPKNISHFIIFFEQNIHVWPANFPLVSLHIGIYEDYVWLAIYYEKSIFDNIAHDWKNITCPWDCFTNNGY
jgi:hypothetical protein